MGARIDRRGFLKVAGGAAATLGPGVVQPGATWALVPTTPKTGRICVRKFNDFNGNGKQDRGEPALTGWVFSIRDIKGNVAGLVKPGKCLDVKPGTYTVLEQVQSGWTPTTPNPQTVTVSPGQTVNVLFGNRRREERCCQFGLMLYNTLTNTVKQIVVIPTNPQAVIGVFNGEEPDWTLTLLGNQYIIAPVAGFVPADSSQVLDLDFALKVDPAKSPTTAIVRWLDANGNLVKEEEVTLVCLPDHMVANEAVEYDWFSKRRTITGVGDKVLFAGAQPEECENFEPEEYASVCFNYVIQCPSGQHVLKLTGDPTSYTPTTYNWEIHDNSTTTVPSGQSVSHQLTEGLHDITVQLKITYYDPVGQTNVTLECSKEIDICIPTADFSMGTVTPLCQGGLVIGYDVEFTPKDENCSSISSYQWTFGDNSPPEPPGSGVPGPITHQYTSSGTYTITLEVTDTWNCTRKKLHAKIISSKCEPRFRIEYEFCPTNQPIVSVPVKFINESQRFCDSTFEWDFGDGSQIPNNSNEVWHTYTVPISQIPKQLDCKLTMKDNPVCNSGTLPSFSIKGWELKPVPLTIQAVVCPDGETHLVAQTSGKVKWKLSAGFPNRCKIRAAFATLLNDKHFNCKLEDGDYSIQATAEEEQQGGLVKATCTKILEFTVTRTCCEDFKAKGYKFRPMGGKTYVMKFRHKVVNPTFGSGTRIVGKTKFKIMKFGPTGFIYFKGIRASEVKVSIKDNLREGGPHPDHPTIICRRCIKAPTLYSEGDERQNSSKAKWKELVSARGTHQQDKLTSVHYVKHKSGWNWTETVEKPQGQMCDQWTITP